MAQALLKFNLEDSDDQMEHLRCVKSTDMALAIWEIVHNTKKSIEWEMEAIVTKEGGKGLNMYEALDLVYDKIYKILEEHDVNIDRLIN